MVIVAIVLDDLPSGMTLLRARVHERNMRNKRSKYPVEYLSSPYFAHFVGLDVILPWQSQTSRQRSLGAPLVSSRTILIRPAWSSRPRAASIWLALTCRENSP